MPSIPKFRSPREKNLHWRLGSDTLQARRNGFASNKQYNSGYSGDLDNKLRHAENDLRH